MAVTVLRIPRQITLTHQVFEEKAPHPGTESSGFRHDAPPVGHIAQIAPTRPAAAPASLLGRPGLRRYLRVPSMLTGEVAVFARRGPADTRRLTCGQQNHASYREGGADSGHRRPVPPPRICADE